MEVHHHSHHPKKWKEYVTEFLMLFAAVTLGFFAENQREHYIENLREVQYMESLIEDLSRDKFDVNESIKFTNTQISYYDTAIALLNEKNWTSYNIKQLYRASLKIGGSRPTTFVDRTSSQLRAGGMRIVRDKKVATLLAEYWQRIDQLNDFEAVSLNGYKQDIKRMSYKIFDGNNYVDAKNKIIKDDAILLTYDRYYLIDYNNRLL
ncbi:MAG: hypothetical protein ACO3B0_09805, partial [Chitinophagaceae bacterium]